jgi:hypothetical protein
MADTIQFIELDGSETALEANCESELRLFCSSFESLSETDVQVYGELHMMAASPGEDAEDPPDVAQVLGELYLVSGGIEAWDAAVVDAVLAPLLLHSFESEDYMDGLLVLMANVPAPEDLSEDDNPVTELAETVFLADGTEATMALSVRDAMAAAASIDSSTKRLAVQAEHLSLSARIGLIFETLVADSAALADALAGDRVITLALADTLRLAHDLDGTIAALAALSDLLALHEYLASVHDDEIEDVAAVTDTIEGLARVMEVIVTDLTFGDTATGMGVFTVLATEDVVLADEVDTATIRLALVSENMRLAVSLSIDGEPYVGLSMHAATRAITEYAGYEYNSLAWFRGKLYGAAETGLLRLEGADDNGAPVLAHIRTAMQRIAGGRAARIQEAFIGFRADGSMQLKVTVPNASGDRISYIYDIDRAPHGGQQVGRFKVGRGIKTVYASFELANGVAGGDFAVDVLEIHPLVLERRLP